MKIELCKFYTTTGYPNFKPKCKRNLEASLKCHSEQKDCPKYKPSETKLLEGKDEPNRNN